ncbi:MAG: ComF family protein [Neisseria sp.]|nr:ComF family protein [Neisseria sp.]
MNLPASITAWCQKLLPTAACPLCHAPADKHGFCAACLADFDALRTPDTVCPLCADAGSFSGVCGHCQRNAPTIDALWASFDYSEPVSTLLHEWKYRALPQHTRSMQSLMLRHPPHFAEPMDFDWVIPVPLSRERLLTRGFNHAQELAKAAATYCSAPLLPPTGIVREHRPAQTTLDRQNRLRNLKNSFSVQFDVNNCNLLLIDDVVTTGATLNELARSLKQKGANRIYAWVLAHKQTQKS